MTPLVPDAIDRVRSYQDAASIAWKDDSKLAKLPELFKMARDEEIAECCILAVVGGCEDEPAPLDLETREARLRMLLSLGFHECPTCFGVIDWSQVERMRELRSQEIEQSRRLERVSRHA